MHVRSELLEDLLIEISLYLLLFQLSFEFHLLFLQLDVLCLHIVKFHPLLVQVLCLRLRIFGYHQLSVLSAELLLLVD